ncbi:hypothetical protein EVAR_67468_1 [Eumeta japonica]|uniref:Uncharacterized protein n=1 Tax=Eumeta variegata TaxID=151549 RepID=A0A4C1ZAT5_EUMVA|nr:hypothetical protein EVAR_67468_1 [Eumeta japonica]
MREKEQVKSFVTLNPKYENEKSAHERVCPRGGAAGRGRAGSRIVLHAAARPWRHAASGANTAEGRRRAATRYLSIRNLPSRPVITPNRASPPPTTRPSHRKDVFVRASIIDTPLLQVCNNLVRSEMSPFNSLTALPSCPNCPPPPLTDQATLLYYGVLTMPAFRLHPTLKIAHCQSTSQDESNKPRHDLDSLSHYGALVRNFQLHHQILKVNHGQSASYDNSNKPEHG